MSLANEMSPADISAVVNRGNNGGGFFGGDSWLSLIILFLFFACMGGWGNGFGGGNGGQNVNENINRGFDQSATMAALGNLGNAVNNGFATAEVAGCNRAMDAMAMGYQNQIASMQQNFAAQSAIDSRLDSLAMALQNCCCENRAATADLKYTVAQDGANTRQVVQAESQKVMDKLCQLELDNYKAQLAQAQRENVGLQNQLNMANFQASQVAQNAQIVDNIYNRLSTCPVGTVPVYGEAPISRCNNNNGCGCMGGFNSQV